MNILFLINFSLSVVDFVELQQQIPGRTLGFQALELVLGEPDTLGLNAKAVLLVGLPSGWFSVVSPGIK